MADAENAAVALARPGAPARPGREADHPAIRARDLVSVTLQLGAVLLVIRQFRIEAGYGLGELLPLILGGFVVHSLLPLRLRLPGFLLLSLMALLVVLGTAPGMAVILTGLTLIAICHLPIALAFRVATLVAVAALLAALRAGAVATPWPSAATVVVPVLAAMFMFRLAIYLYDLNHERSPASLWQRLSYFFLLPNVCFLLFPVVDYQTFRRTYYDKPACDIYQKGVLWMIRGVIHLLLYRTIYYYYTIAPADVVDLGSAVHYMVSTYLLYLHISGQFHLIIGILCLFGFNLPETHHLFYLASGFNDYWRRINIYWKDFMMKMVYYPVLMRVRVMGLVAAIAIATVAVFFTTWILHAYQWFWLRGEFALTATDALFWGILGILVVVNSTIEARFRRKRRLTQGTWSTAGAFLHALKVVAMLVTLTVLWTLWNSASVADFAQVISVAMGDSLESWSLFLLVLAGLVGLGVLMQYVSHKGLVLGEVGNAPDPRRSAVIVGAVSVTLIALSGGFPLYLDFGSRTDAFVRSLATGRLNEADQKQMEAGYYEGLLDMGGYTSALARLQGRQPADWDNLRETEFVVEVDHALDFRLAPSAEGRFKGASFSTNAWGMRDGDYELEKPPGALRIALLGASYNMGSGVSDEEVFEAILERMLEQQPPIDGYESYEMLNFSVGAYSLLHQSLIIEPDVARFSPDIAVLTVHATEVSRLSLHLRSLVLQDKRIEYAAVTDALEAAGIHADIPPDQLLDRLERVALDLEQELLHDIASKLRAAGITPVAVYLPTTLEHEGIDVERRDAFERMCREAGFRFLQVDNPFETEDVSALQLGEWDTHPNAEGHQQIAQKMLDLMAQNPDTFRPDG